jgi:hypothetical protein
MPVPLLKAGAALLPLIDNEILLPAAVAAMKDNGMNMNGLGESQLDAAMQKLRAQAAEWQGLYSRFVAAEPIDKASALYTRWVGIKKSADSAKGKIQAAFDAVGGAASWVSSVFGLGQTATLSSLGIVPLVIASAALAAVFLTAQQMRGYLTDIERLKAQERVVMAGKAEPGILVNPGGYSTPIGEALGGLSGIAKWGAIGLAAWLAYKAFTGRGA